MSALAGLVRGAAPPDGPSAVTPDRAHLVSRLLASDATTERMVDTLTAGDLWPLASKMPRQEQLRLAMRLLRCAEPVSDAAAYAAARPVDGEFGVGDDDAMGWEGDGWEEFYAPR